MHRKTLITTKALPLTILIITFSLVTMAFAEEPLEIEYFHKPKCKTCGGKPNGGGFDQMIMDLELEYLGQIEVEWLDVNEQEALDRLIAYNLTRTPAAVFNHEYRMVHVEITPESLREAVNTYLTGSEVTFREEHLPVVSTPLIIVSGLIDGVNPCAFALLTFFLSFLFSIHRTRRSILGMGAAYIAGLFVVYLALGLGLLNTMTLLGIERPFGMIGAAFLILLGFVNVRDAVAWSRDLLKFPRVAIPTIKHLANKAALPAALALGGLVSMLEFTCSGGVYVGILVLLSSKAQFWEGIIYLMLYNLMFIVPLVIILLMASNAETLLKMDRWRVLKRRQMKMVTGIFMIALGIATLYWMFM